MQNAAMTSRFLTGCSSSVGLADSEIVVSRGGLLRHIVAWHLAQTVHSQDLFVKLTNELIASAEQAYVMRDVGALDEVSHVLMNLPVDAARQIGSYYYALALNRQRNRAAAEALLQETADDAPATYRARAIQTLGGNYHDKGQLDEALRFQLEALRAASDRTARGLQTTLLARWEISIIRGLDGDHRGALSDLKDLSPLVNLAAKQQPFYFAAYCNDLAVELGELGRIAEAEAALEVALASPYAPAHPNWAETRQELEAKRTSATRSVVAINRTSEVISAQQTQRKPRQTPKRVVAFSWLRNKRTSIQITSIAIVRFWAIAIRRTNRDTLDRLDRCIRSRAPPPRF
jgi:tetratricopeptide (TPR) repeat protein